MKTLWCKNQENPSDRISHAWAPLNICSVESKKLFSEREVKNVSKVLDFSPK
jgi:hypothetical protein